MILASRLEFYKLYAIYINNVFKSFFVLLQVLFIIFIEVVDAAAFSVCIPFL